MINFSIILAVATGGAIGATVRLLINGFMNKHFVNTLPLGTLIVNLLGSLIMGMLFAYFHQNTTFPTYLKIFMTTGILGALTTYSTFAIESFLMFEAGNYLYAFANITLNLFGTILLAGVGYILVVEITK